MGHQAGEEEEVVEEEEAEEERRKEEEEEEEEKEEKEEEEEKEEKEEKEEEGGSTGTPLSRHARSNSSSAQHLHAKDFVGGAGGGAARVCGRVQEHRSALKLQHLRRKRKRERDRKKIMHVFDL